MPPSSYCPERVIEKLFEKPKSLVLSASDDSADGKLGEPSEWGQENTPKPSKMTESDTTPPQTSHAQIP